MVNADAVKATLTAIYKNADARNWGWYYTQDEEHYYGPYDTRDDAIAAGQKDYCGEPFHVAECHKGLIQVAVFEKIAEQIDDWNNDQAAEGTYPTEDITAAQWRELEAELNVVAAKWCARHNLTNWAFDEIRNKSEHNREQDE